MERNEFNWDLHQPHDPLAALTPAEIEQMARLMSELKELTQSRGSYQAATEFLKRFGYDGDIDTLVRPERLAN